MLKGLREYKKFLKGEKLTHKKAILAQCYSCNGFEESNVDCQGKSCSLYSFHPYREKGQEIESMTA